MSLMQPVGVDNRPSLVHRPGFAIHHAGRRAGPRQGQPRQADDRHDRGGQHAAPVGLAFEILGPMLPQVQAKVIRALAVTSDKRYPGLPNVPPVPRRSRSNTSGGPICPPLSISSRPSRAG